jgi:hypothetical protein
MPSVTMVIIIGLVGQSAELRSRVGRGSRICQSQPTSAKDRS